MRARCPERPSYWLSSPCHPVPAQVRTKHLKPPKDSQRLATPAACDPFFSLSFEYSEPLFSSKPKIRLVAKLHGLRLMPTHNACNYTNEFRKAPILDFGPISGCGLRSKCRRFRSTHKRVAVKIVDDRALRVREFWMSVSKVFENALGVLRLCSGRTAKGVDFPSFPHALSGGSTQLTTGESEPGPPIRTFGGDGFGTIYYFDT